MAGEPRFGVFYKKDSSERIYESDLVNKETLSYKTIDDKTAMIYEGRAYITDWVGNINQESSKIFMVSTNSKMIYLPELVIAFEEDELKLSMAEDSSWDQDTGSIGELMDTFNLNRNYPDAPDGTIYQDPEEFTEGTVIHEYKLFGGHKVGAVAPTPAEFYVKDDAVYSFEVQNETTNDIEVSITIFWYETVAPD